MKNNDSYKRIRPLIAYYQKYGTIKDIKQNELFDYNGETIKIGWLITNLRQDKRKGLISDNLVEFLDYIGMSWNGQDFFSEWIDVFFAWYEKYKTLSNLTQYSKIEYKGEVVNIGNMLHRAREYKINGTLSDAQIEYLDMLGIVWAPKDKETAYDMLVLYKKLYGSIANIRLDETFVYEDKVCRVGKQINHLRTRYNKGLLSDEEIEFFENLGMVWNKKNKREVENTFDK